LPAGVDVGVSVALTTNRNVDTVLGVFSYDACVMTGMQPSNLPSTGSLFSVSGMNFGKEDDMGKRNVRIGGTVHVYKHVYIASSSISSMVDYPSSSSMIPQAYADTHPYSPGRPATRHRAVE
jgi:hypothetical protein